MSAPAPARPARSRLGALALVDLLVDAGSFECWDADEVVMPAPADTPGYRAELAAARERSGVDEAIVTGAARIEGHRAALAVNEFGFLAGSIGVAAARRLVAAIERATAARLPVIAVSASGGTRMQEGALAFVQMPAIAAAVAAHKVAGLPYLVYQRHPTTGGVFASWGSLGHVTIAEPDALIGFLGPKVYRGLYGEPFPEGVQRAENLLAHGMVDAVIAPQHLRAYLAGLLGVLEPRGPTTTTADTGLVRTPMSSPATVAGGAWESVLRTRRPDRPGLAEVLAQHPEHLVRLNGTGHGEAAGGLVVAITRLAGRSCMVIGQDRAAQHVTPLGPAALRTVRRALALAGELGLAVVTVIDTPGAELSASAEQGGLAAEVAACLADAAALTVPRVSVLLGQGSGRRRWRCCPPTGCWPRGTHG